MIQIQRWLPYTGVLITHLEGSIYVEIPADHPKAGTISRLWVNESSRHKGTARHLLATAEEQAKNLGCKKVYLCWTEGEAEEWTREWYERNGYKKIERRGIDHWYAKSLL
jgi:N-acetylglutamate synthase-like GNAT family acetyltransferase